MRFDVVTIFPAMFDPAFKQGVVGRARERGVIALHAHDLRDFTHDRHRQVDDVPFGGGPGMVMKPEPVIEAVESIRRENLGPVLITEYAEQGAIRNPMWMAKRSVGPMRCMRIEQRRPGEKSA